MNTKIKNILELSLQQLKVKFTKIYVNKLYDINPYRNSFWGLSNMLSEYQVQNRGIKMNEKNELSSLTVPFIANIEGESVLIERIKDEEVNYIRKGQEEKMLLEDFRNRWDGTALLIEKTEKSIEPNYKENYKKQLFNILRKNALAACIIVSLVMGIIINNLYMHWGLSLLLIINMAGSYISYLLLLKQMYIQNDQADKICSLFKKGGCNTVLESPAAKFMGIIGWSEVGFGYFISNILILALFPTLLPYLVLVNICALPYSFWSVWYQWFKAKEWCPLCLIVQILLWMIFVINMIFHHIAIPQFIATDFFLMGIIYLLPFLIISFSLPKLIIERHSQFLIKEINELRMKPEVFEALLKKDPATDIDLSTSQIIWGNKDADTLISIVTNPHCVPCAMTHKSVEKLLDRIGYEVCIQYIFASFNEELKSSAEFLTAAYLSDNTIEKKKEIYNEWFEKGKNDRENFFNKYAFNINNPNVENEINKHQEWRERNNIQVTPAIFINGYKLPYNYRIEDVVYFTDLKI